MTIHIIQLLQFSMYNVIAVSNIKLSEADIVIFILLYLSQNNDEQTKHNSIQLSIIYFIYWFLCHKKIIETVEV